MTAKASTAVGNARRHEAALWRAAAHGDAIAFTTAWQRQEPSLRMIALRLLPSSTEADEVLHLARCAAWARLGSYSADRGSVATWLAAIVRHKAFDWQRARRREAERARVFGDGWRSYTVQCGLPSGYECLAAAETNRTVTAALDALPLARADAVSLAFLDGLSHAEIASLLGMPVGTTKANIRRGLAAMRVSLGGQRRFG